MTFVIDSIGRVLSSDAAIDKAHRLCDRASADIECALLILSGTLAELALDCPAADAVRAALSQLRGATDSLDSLSRNDFEMREAK